MIGISKKELIELIENPQMDLDKYTIRALITRCEELDPWIPIDENTPRDRRLILFYPAEDWRESFTEIHFYTDDRREATHYKEQGPI